MLSIKNSNILVDLTMNKIFENINNKLIELKPNRAGLYSFKLDGVIYTKRYEWISLYAKFGIYFLSEHKHQVDNLYFVKYRPYGVARLYHENALPLFKYPVEIFIKGKNFRLVARYPQYAVSSEGEVWSLITNKFIKPRQYHTEGYITVPIMDNYYKKKRQNWVSVHKLVALAWVKNNDYIKNNIIDHKDNIKYNNHFSNLIWCSGSNNLSKTIYEKRSNNIITRNIDTNDIKEYNSLKSCCNDLDIPKIDTKLDYLNLGRIWVSKDKKNRFEILFKKDFKDWYYPEKNGEVKRNRGKVDCKNAEFYNLKTKLIFTGLSREQVLKLLNIKSISIVNSRMTKRAFNVPINDWLVKLNTDITFEELSKNIVIPKNTSKKIELIGMEDNKILNVNSIYEIQKLTGLDYRTIYNRVKTKTPLLIDNKKYLLTIKSAVEYKPL